MKGSVERLAVLLAASGLSERDITDALRASKNLDEKEFIERVVFLRQFLFSGLDVNDVSSSGQRIAAGNKDQIRAVERATQLLQTEARLNPTRAADLLCKSLAEDNFDLEIFQNFEQRTDCAIGLLNCRFSRANYSITLPKSVIVSCMRGLPLGRCASGALRCPVPPRIASSSLQSPSTNISKSTMRSTSKAV
jgi:hypothetical protein